jgi:hypothetical protein
MTTGVKVKVRVGRTKRGGLGQAVTGLLIMAAGVVLLLDQTGIIEIGSVGRYWPLVLVAFGIGAMTGPAEKRDVGGGAMLIVFGLWILACTQHWQGLTFRNSWPLVFVAIGIKMVLRALAPKRPALAPAVGAAAQEAADAVDDAVREVERVFGDPKPAAKKEAPDA